MTTRLLSVLILVGGLCFFIVNSRPSTATTRVNTSRAISDDGLCASQTNLLQNPSFEGDYLIYNPSGGHPQCPDGPCTSVRTAEHWNPWWTLHNDSDPEYVIKMPEFTAAEADFWYGPERTRSGDRAQQYFTLYATHEAGVYQQLSASVGGEYCFSAWGHSWSANDDPDPLNNAGDALSGPEFGQMWQKVGIDPTGGTDWTSADIVWSDQETNTNGRNQYDVNGLFLITATAQAETITVFIYSQPDYAVKHNNVYWDDSTLSLLSLPSIVVTANSQIAAITTITESLSLTRTVTFEINSPSETATWTAVLSAGNTITPTFTPSGGENDGMDVSLDTTWLTNGSYTAEIVVTTTPELVGSPITIPIQVFIVDNVFSAYLPLIMR